MSIWGKIIGGAAGFAIGGPLGALLGGVAGHVYDRRPASADARPEKQIAFTIAVVALGAKLAKADGVVTEDEVAAFREVFQVPPDQVKNVARVFDLARRHTEGYEPYARQVAGMFADNPAVLEELLACLFHIAKADGRVAEAELAYIQGVARIFGFSDAEFRRIHAEEAGLGATDPYTIIGVRPDIGDAELKAAHRRLVRENHPDSLIAQGMPEEFVAVANEKLAVINAAYDRIKDERGIN